MTDTSIFKGVMRIVESVESIFYKSNQTYFKKVESVESLDTYRYIKCTQVYPTLKLSHVSTNRLCVLLFQVGIFQTRIELNPGVGPHTSISKSFKNFITVFNTRMRYILEP